MKKMLITLPFLSRKHFSHNDFASFFGHLESSLQENLEWAKMIQAQEGTSNQKKSWLNNIKSFPATVGHSKLCFYIDGHSTSTGTLWQPSQAAEVLSAASIFTSPFDTYIYNEKRMASAADKTFLTKRKSAIIMLRGRG
jgi:hypothetical protein